MVNPIEILEKTNIKQHQAIIDKVNDIVDVVNGQGLETIKDTVNDVKARVGVLENENDTQDTEISQLGTRVTATEKKNTTQDSQISEVTGRVATAESDIDSLQAGKLDKDQGSSNAGKVLIVGGDGIVKPGTSSASVAWGGISGDLADQTDLSDALDAKADDADVTALGTRVTAVETGTVKTTGDQTVAGVKTLTDSPRIHRDWPVLYFDDTEADINTPPVEWKRHGGMVFTDRNGVNMGIVDNSTYPDGNVCTQMTAVSVIASGKTATNAIQVFTRYSDGVGVAYAPPTLPSANGNHIATAKWVNEKINGKLNKNQGPANAGKALVVGSDGMVTPGDVGGGGGGPIVYGWENPNSFTAFNEQIKTLYQSVSSAQSSNLGHFNFKQYLSNSNISQVKRIDLTISATVSNNALKLTAEFCVIFPYTPSGDEVVSRVDISFNRNGIDYIILVTADKNITFCDSGRFVEKTEWEFISNN